MIPQRIEGYLKDRHIPYEPSVHFRAVPAQRLAAAEHVPGDRVAKPVVVDLDGELAIAVVSASERADVEALRRATGARRAELAPEARFAEVFAPCEAGAEPPLALFGMRIFVDDALAREPWVVMRAGTHEDAVRVDTAAWLVADRVTPVPHLGRHLL